MSKTSNRRLFPHNVNKFIWEFPDLKYDHCQIICLVCNRSLLAFKRSICVNHVNSAIHKRKKGGNMRYTRFIFDLIIVLCACNVPFFILDKEQFRQFWNKYNLDYKLPSRRTVQRYLPFVRERIEDNIKSQIYNKKLCLVVDEITDSKKHYVANVLVRTLDPLGPSPAYLLASKRLSHSTTETIQHLILTTLEKWEVPLNNVLIFSSDSASVMISVGRKLKDMCPNLLHITCILYGLHLSAEIIRKCYPDVDSLIANTKAVFLKSPEHIREFQKQCPGIPEPSQPIPTYWGAWLETAIYYYKHFQAMKSLVLQFNGNESVAIRESQIKFQDALVESDLTIIHSNYRDLADAINKLQKTSLSLGESLQILDDVQKALHMLGDENGIRVRDKLDSVIRENPDFDRLKLIYSNSAKMDPLSEYSDYFNYANLTSVDVERSFLLYKDIFSPHRTSFAETTLETLAMLQLWSQYNLDLSLDL